jgi:hypothetical protein
MEMGDEIWEMGCIIIIKQKGRSSSEAEQSLRKRWVVGSSPTSGFTTDKRRFNADKR